MEVCSKCHLFTGKQKLVDTGGRVAKLKFGLDRDLTSQEVCRLGRPFSFSKSAYTVWYQ